MREKWHSPGVAQPRTKSSVNVLGPRLFSVPSRMLELLAQSPRQGPRTQHPKRQLAQGPAH